MLTIRNGRVIIVYFSFVKKFLEMCLCFQGSFVFAVFKFSPFFTFFFDVTPICILDFIYENVNRADLFF